MREGERERERGRGGEAYLLEVMAPLLLLLNCWAV